jgi:hypothetical protein
VRTIVSMPGVVKFTVSGRNGSYTPSNLSLAAIMIVDSPYAMTGECGQATFSGPPPIPNCLYNGLHTRITCRQRKP